MRVFFVQNFGAKKQKCFSIVAFLAKKKALSYEKLARKMLIKLFLLPSNRFSTPSRDCCCCRQTEILFHHKIDEEKDKMGKCSKDAKRDICCSEGTLHLTISHWKEAFDRGVKKFKREGV